MKRVGKLLIELLVVNAPLKIVALLLAIVITINARDQTFRNVTFDMPVVASGLPPRWILQEELPASLRVSIRATVDRITEILPKPPEYKIDLSTAQNGESIFFRPENVEELLGEGVHVSAVTPSFFTVRLEERGSKVVPVKVKVAVNPKPYYFVEQDDIRVEPSKVELQGPVSALERIGAIETVDLDLSRHSSDFVGRVRLVPPTGVKAVPPVVDVTIPVREKYESRVLESARMVVRNCPPGLVCTVTPGFFRARISGKKRVVESFNRDNLSYYVYIDGSRLPIAEGKLRTEFSSIQPVIESPRDAKIVLLDEKYFNVSVRREARQ